MLFCMSGYIIGYLAGWESTEQIAIATGNLMPLRVIGKGLIKSRKGKKWQGIQEILISNYYI